MGDPTPAGMMRTRKGTRIATRPANDGDSVVLVIFGIEITMTGDESHQLRDNLQEAELQARAGEAFDEL